MSKTIQTLSPKGLWQHFYQLTRIPRPSRHEGPVQAFVKLESFHRVTAVHPSADDHQELPYTVWIGGIGDFTVMKFYLVNR